MSEARVPALKYLVLWTVQALRDLGGSGSNAEILEKVIEVGRISESAQAIAHKNGRKGSSRCVRYR